MVDKLGVTDKAISKWENGRCLMDISLLKPLSECLDISVIELINGEKILSEDVSVKSSEAIEKTFTYANRRIKKSRIRIVSVVSLLCIFLIFFTYKGSLLYFLTAFNVNLNKVGMVNPVTGTVVTLDDLFYAIGLDDSDLCHKVLKTFQRNQSNEFLGDTVYDIAEKYDMHVLSKRNDCYLKVLTKKR